MARSGSEGDLDFIPALSALESHGYARYRVMLRGELIGEVFPFRPDADAPSLWWAAQGTDGLLRGVFTRYGTRKEAARALVPVQW